MPAANPERGEVALTVGDRSYILVLDFDGICAAEEAMSDQTKAVTIAEIVLHAARGSHRHARVLAWAALKRRQPDITLEHAGEVIVSVGGVDAFFDTVKKLRKSLEPDQEDRPARPRKARVNGTGAVATSLAGASGSIGTRSGVSPSKSSSVR